MKFIPTITLLFFGQILFGQIEPKVFINTKNAYYNKTAAKDIFFEPKINEITLNPNFTFKFWSRPHASCFTWHEYKGTWRTEKDTLFFSDNYEIAENDVRATYGKDERQLFVINFKTDKSSPLKNRAIKIQYVYDYNAHLQDTETAFSLNTDNRLEIPFKDVPNVKQLAAIRIEYQLNFVERRYAYLTESKTLNVKQGDIPNLINVEFVEKPKKEIVYRTIKAINQNNALAIISTTKTKTTLPDYHRDIEFEDSYALRK